MNWERFFFYLGRINSVLLFAVIIFVTAIIVVNTVGYGSLDEPSAEPYGVSGLDGEANYSGAEIALADGTVVKYIEEGLGELEAEIHARNVSLTHMTTGASRLVLPRNGQQVVFRFEQISENAQGAEPASAYIVLAGTEEDYAEGRLDLIVGRFSDLEQKVVAQQICFVDSVRMIDENTLSMIVWTSNDEAEFWLFDIRTMTKALSRRVEVPARTSGKESG